jgi:hypothetical protein
MNMYNEVVRLHRKNTGLWSLFKEIGSEAQKYEIVVLLVSFVSIIVLIVLVSNNQANDVYKWLLGSLEVFTLFVLVVHAVNSVTHLLREQRKPKCG